MPSRRTRPNLTVVPFTTPAILPEISWALAGTNGTKSTVLNITAPAILEPMVTLSPCATVGNYLGTVVAPSGSGMPTLF